MVCDWIAFGGKSVGGRADYVEEVAILLAATWGPLVSLPDQSDVLRM